VLGREENKKRGNTTGKKATTKKTKERAYVGRKQKSRQKEKNKEILCSFLEEKKE
jgi:hypothetical protein